MLFVTIFKSIIFCSLVAGRPLETQQVNRTQHLSRRARSYSVIPVDGSADRTSSTTTPIKTTIVTTVETAITTKIVTVPEDPVTQTILLIISANSNKPDLYQSTMDIYADDFSLSVQEQPTPTSTVDRNALHSPSETIDKESPSRSPTSVTATTTLYREERSRETDHMFLDTYRWSNTTSGTYEGSASTMNDDTQTISSY